MVYGVVVLVDHPILYDYVYTILIAGNAVMVTGRTEFSVDDKKKKKKPFPFRAESSFFRSFRRGHVRFSPRFDVLFIAFC